MTTNDKRAVNARKAGLRKQNAQKELMSFAENFMEFYPPEDVDEMLDLLLNVAMVSPEFDTFEPIERANLRHLLDGLTLMTYLVRDVYLYERSKTEKAAI